MMDYHLTTVEHLSTLLARSNLPDPVIFLGAGASVKSGIPLSSGLVERAAKWAYCRTMGLMEDDFTVKRSDWFPWLEKQSWYHRDLPVADNYSAAFDYLLQPREERKEFLLRLIDPKVPASLGYERLVEFMASGAIRTILTTNFDSVLAKLCEARNRPHHVEILKTLDDFTKFSTMPTHPQVIYVHGSVEHYTDKNLVKEVQQLNTDLITQLLPLLRDHPLIVLGYRGAEPSIMQHLLLKQCSHTNDFRHGIFWCATQGSIKQGLHPLVEDLARAIGGNFQVIPIKGFDETLDALWELYQQHHTVPTTRPTNLSAHSQKEQPYDMQPVSEVPLDSLDWSRLQHTLSMYCERLSIPMPSSISQEWLIERMCEFDLAYKTKTEVVLTVAGCLLFAQRPIDFIPSAQITLRIGGETERIITGHLWNQLDQVMDALIELNRPYRLKDHVSTTVTPYPQLALKELVVNALVHRSYQESQQVILEIEPTHLRITNPGGLVDGVIRSVQLPLQEEIERGRRGIKGYRNPVIADVFYSAGAMDKAGSGLADVQQWVAENAGTVHFGPNQSNSAFDVTIFRRPETVDEVTGVASPLAGATHFISNLLEVQSWPDTVWFAETSARHPKDIWEHAVNETLPAFILADGSLYTFTDLQDQTSPFEGLFTESTVSRLDTNILLASEDGQRRFVRLLNQCIFQYLDGLGLIIERQRQRAYFPRTESGVCEITYQARLRRAKRTVTKPILSPTTGKVRYWEHEAVRFSFGQFDGVWALQLIPGYAFTVNGWREMVAGPRIAALATRRAARDYNPQVHNDLIFWLWVLAQGNVPIQFPTGIDQGINLSGAYLSGVTREFEPIPDALDLEVQMTQNSADLEEEIAEWAELSQAHDEEGSDDLIS